MNYKNKHLNKKEDIIQALKDINTGEYCKFSKQIGRKRTPVCERCALNHCVYNFQLLKDSFGDYGKNKHMIKEIIAEIKKIATVQQYQTPNKARVMLVQIINRINCKNK